MPAASTSCLRDFAAAAWPAGFPPDFGDDAFEALLDEMVGLGLLRGVEGTHYALRSANLAHLIGNQGEIKRQIDAFLARPAPAETDPLETRRLIDGRPSLLTARQEGNMLAPGSGALVLAGMSLAGIGEWQKAVREACDFARRRRGLAVRVELMRMPYDRQRFYDGVERLARRGAADGLALYLVPPAAAWDADWIAEAQKRLSTPVKGVALGRVLFVADGLRAWTWVGDPMRRAVLDGGATGARVIELAAGPWSRTALDFWLTMDNSIGLPPDAVLAATGGWERMITRLAANPDRHEPVSPEALAVRLLAPDQSGDRCRTWRLCLQRWRRSGP